MSDTFNTAAMQEQLQEMAAEPQDPQRRKPAHLETRDDINRNLRLLVEMQFSLYSLFGTFPQGNTAVFKELCAKIRTIEDDYSLALRMHEALPTTDDDLRGTLATKGARLRLISAACTRLREWAQNFDVWLDTRVLPTVSNLLDLVNLDVIDWTFFKERLDAVLARKNSEIESGSEDAVLHSLHLETWAFEHFSQFKDQWYCHSLGDQPPFPAEFDAQEWSADDDFGKLVLNARQFHDLGMNIFYRLICFDVDIRLPLNADKLVENLA